MKKILLVLSMFVSCMYANAQYEKVDSFFEGIGGIFKGGTFEAEAGMGLGNISSDVGFITNMSVSYGKDFGHYLHMGIGAEFAFILDRYTVDRSRDYNYTDVDYDISMVPIFYDLRLRLSKKDISPFVDYMIIAV